MNIQKTNFAGNWDARHLKLLMIIFSVALIAKGGVLSRGFAVDDYSFGQGFTKGDLGFFLTQGRFLLGSIDWVIDSLGVNISDIYVSLGFLALLLQAAFVVSLLRFVGAADAPEAMLAGSLMVAHPYLAEILTFRMVLPGYCVAAALSILALEAVAKNSAGYRSNIVALLATLGMLFVYQGFLNYFAVAIIFAYLFGVFAQNEVSRKAAEAIGRKRRAVVLTFVCAFSAFLFLAILSASKRFGLIELTGRANFIEWQEIPTRLGQVRDLLLRVYWQGEPVAPHWIKVVIALMIATAVFVLIPVFTKGSKNRRFLENTLCVVLAACLLIPATVGVIVPFKEWWPVPRVLSQVSAILGLLFLLAWSHCRDTYAKIPLRILTTSTIIVIIAFVFINNQIFADQVRLNSWDKMQANRIISRLEMRSDFSKVESVFVSGGSWRHAGRLNTIQGDMNISAFSPAYSKVPLLLEASGYDFKKASDGQNAAGENYCANVRPWPDKESVSIIDGLAIVCLPK